MEGLGEDEVRRRLAAGAYYGRNLESVQAWLQSRQRNRANQNAERDQSQRREELQYLPSARNAAWAAAIAAAISALFAALAFWFSGQK